jgi:hypothetical protein
MKKVVVSILMILYLGSFSGIAMDIHYCMGKKSGVDFFDTDKGKCGKCGMKAKKGCCQDEHKFYKLLDTHKNVSNDINFETFSVPVFLSYNLFDWHLADISFLKEIQNNSPPNYSGPSLCVLNCIFRL